VTGDFSPVSPQHVDTVLGVIIRGRAAKALAAAADRPVDTVKGWQKHALPQGWATLANLVRNDDEVAKAWDRLTGRTAPAAFDVADLETIDKALRIVESRR